CCTWEGVKCSNRTGHVVKLKLSGCGYEARVGGEISPSLTALHHLRYLDLSCSNFSGVQIPKFLGSLTNLQHLDLSRASFVGRVPPQLGNLSKLAFLSVSANSLYSDDLAWLSHLTSLQYLDMSFVNLSSVVDWVHAINKLPPLKVLCLEDSDLRNSPATLSHYNLTALRVLDISGNRFHTALSANWFWHITTLTSLDLSTSDLHGSIPDEMGNMTSLEEVHIGGYETSLTGIIPSNLKNLCNLKIVDLSESNTTGDIGELMERLPKCSWDKLYSLDFSDNNIGGSLPNWLGPLPNLTILDLSNNYIEGPMPLWIGSLPQLAFLYLYSNQLVGEMNEDHLEGLRSLQELRMSDNSVSMVVRSDWVPSFRLQVAKLRSCRLGPTFPAWLRSQSNIQVIDISNASITDDVPDWFWTLASNATLLD
ncbi:receptor-like protein EIX1, partial [Triticum dicoccoides]